MNFDMVDKLFRGEFKLSRKELKKQGFTYYNYFFDDKTADTKRRNVAVEVRELQNGEVAGYIYVDVLAEYQNHPEKLKMGHLKISRLTMTELENILNKVVAIFDNSTVC